MGCFEEELLLDAEDDARAVEYIRTHLSQELQEKISDEQLYYFLDLIFEYYAESGILEATPDAEGYIDIDEEVVAEYLVKKAKKEGIGEFTVEELLFVVQAEMDYREEQEAE